MAYRLPDSVHVHYDLQHVHCIKDARKGSQLYLCNAAQFPCVDQDMIVTCLNDFYLVHVCGR